MASVGKKFTTLDTYLSSYLSLKGMEPKLEFKADKIGFPYSKVGWTVHYFMNDIEQYMEDQKLRTEE